MTTRPDADRVAPTTANRGYEQTASGSQCGYGGRRNGSAGCRHRGTGVRRTADDLQRTVAPAPLLASTYLAGWQTTQIGISRASVAFDVPTMTCGPEPDVQGIAAGIGNEQVAGTPTLQATVWLACSQGAPVFQAVAIAGGDFGVDTAASAGDRVVITVVQTRTNVKATVNNVTTGVRTTASGPPTPDNSLTFGAFPISGVDQVGNFGTVRMLKPTLENTFLRLWSPTKLTRVEGGVKKITATNFNPTTEGFSLHFHAN